MEEVKKNYYAVIPANVRYDEDLPPNAKLLYGEITALCNEKGYCWATNSYFSELYKVSKVSISNWISLLIKKGYLKSEIIYKEGSKEILNRYLKIINEPIKENFNTPIKENFKDNNTSINNTDNKENYNKSVSEETSEQEELSEEELLEIDEHNFGIIWSMYPRKDGKTEAFKKFRKWVSEGRKVNGRKIVLTNEQIFDAVAKYKREVEFTDIKYIKQGSTFFGDCILDYIVDS